ncbi:hypothetical protein FFWV33_09660 [Flavobacterium faecale]|uniref:Ig-like domain-containing protein n=1 Tax=Flavobacterium faecale TaxID=1355330 RepID=A0A2S1LDJ3_9FLAO|nr:T9SS type B sorting domain-containing protein [Flavobacterium faecale]AWG21788.1 hypothetical protein FFWV33_09660 [Flavobacterium faecale]
MKKSLNFIFFLMSFSFYGQYTQIPDVNFEKALIYRGIDSGVPDGKILTSTINSITYLNVSVYGIEISDLTGIEGFTNLTNLACQYNKLTTLDVSKNTKLTVLYCYNNLLTNLDISKNTNLKVIDCKENFLTRMDVSNNINLTNLWCNNNLLTYLNLKNGHNNLLQSHYSNFWGNSNLFCIIVDDVAYSDTNWYFLKNSSTTFTTLENPAPEIPSPQFFCSANTKTLADIIITTGTNLSWYHASTGGSAIPNTNLLDNNTTYYASQGSSECESIRTVVKVIFDDNQPPIPNLATLPSITGDCKTQITTTPTATDACAGTISATTTSPLSYNLPGTYTIVWTYDDGNGNKATQNQTVIITPQPLPTATASQTFCLQQNATLSDITITGQSIKWYDSLANGNLLLNTTALQNGIMYYASQTIDGCESERTPVSINIPNTPAPTATLKQTFCSSQNPTLATIAINGTAVKWYDSPIGGLQLVIGTPLVDGNFYYASQTQNSCESILRQMVQIELIDTLPAMDHSEVLCDDLNDGKEIVNLNSYTNNLIASTNGYTFDFYSTKTGAENELATTKITTTATYALKTGINELFVRINSSTSCYGIAVLQLTVVDKPKITIPDTVAICDNATITITADAGYDQYLWSTGQTTPQIIITTPDDYWITVTKNYGAIACTTTKNFSVKKSTIAVVTAIETTDWTDNQNTIMVMVTGNGDYEYALDDKNYQSSNQFTNLIAGNYVVYVRDRNGCGTTLSEVALVMYPKFFTPNNDGHNDNWSLVASNPEDGWELKVFDRYGKLIKTLLKNQSWDGTFNGQNLPATDYWFIATKKDGTEFKGHFSLKR